MSGAARPGARRRRALVAGGVVVVALSLAASCGGPGVDESSADAHATAGARLAAAERWWGSADEYEMAFALEDPVPERAARRADLALLRAHALGRAGRGTDALAWLRVAERLEPGARLVELERGRVQDGSVPETIDIGRAIAAYRAYLAAWRSAGAPEAEREEAAEAEARLESLTR